MSATPIIESVAANPVKKGSRWLVCLAKPGQGSSGFYSEEVLRETGPIAFPPKTKAYFGHNPPEKRDPRDQLGTYPDGAFWNEESGELQAYLQPYKRWQPVIEEMGSDLELSIYAAGNKDDAGNVVELLADRVNSIDAVGYGGLVGSAVKEQVESLVESARAEYTDLVPTSAWETKRRKRWKRRFSKRLFRLRSPLPPSSPS